MTFWIITSAMALLITGLLAQAMLRARAADLPDAADYDLKVYRDQLSEVDRDVARGVLSQEDAERARAEISRRILSTDAAAPQATVAAVPPLAAILGMGAVLVAGSLALYLQIGAPGYGDLSLENRKAMAAELRENRPTQEMAQNNMPPFVEPEGMDPQFSELLGKLRETVAQRPGDLQGQEFLVQYEARIGNFTAAADAQRAILNIKGEEVSAADIADYAELLVFSAGGYVSPEAETAFRAALAQDETDGRSLYYIGLVMVQTGRPDIAFRLWDRLLRQGPPDAAWIAPIRSQIMAVSQVAGMNDYTIPPIGGGDTRGPTAADIEAAANLSTEERMEMISGMIEGLSNRLATEGGPPEDWARLITSLAITGQPDQALAVFNNAVEVFDGNDAAMDVIRAAGSQAGVAE